MSLKYLIDENVNPLYPNQIRQIKPQLIIIAEASFDDEYQDQIIHLPLTKIKGDRLIL